ncbi:hypothetical protein GCM10011359_18670 [Nesterenkonia alkaliphila]|nr:hypothetical protein GCM10011359_18670 [Nesterenkonia alkaliphila]
MGEHLVEPDHRDRQGEHDPEQAAELAHVITVTAMTPMSAVVVMTTMTGVAFVAGMVIVPVVALVVVVTAVLVVVMMLRSVLMRGVPAAVSMMPVGIVCVVHAGSVPPVLVRTSARHRGDQLVGSISDSTTHLWLVMVMSSASTSTT